MKSSGLKMKKVGFKDLLKWVVYRNLEQIKIGIMVVRIEQGSIGLPNRLVAIRAWAGPARLAHLARFLF